MRLKSNFLPTGIGSLPYLNPEEACQKVFSNFKELPFWPQLPKKSFLENMYVQFSEGLPGIVIDEANKKIFVDNLRDLSEEFVLFYENYLSNDPEQFKINKNLASGLYSFYENCGLDGFEIVKGQITGPLSFGLSIVDKSGRSIIYDDSFKEIILKLLEMKARWQIKYLRKVSKDIIVFIDEPYLANFGSSFFNIEKEEIIASLNAIIDAIHNEGITVGIHCCGNTDWSLLSCTHTDIISFDSYSFSESLALYPDEIRKFLERGGFIAWGAVPTSEVALSESGDSLFKRLEAQMKKISQKALPIELLYKNSLITPSCGLGTLTPELADNIIQKTIAISRLARDKFFSSRLRS